MKQQLLKKLKVNDYEVIVFDIFKSSVFTCLVLAGKLFVFTCLVLAGKLTVFTSLALAKLFVFTSPIRVGSYVFTCLIYFW